MASDAPIPSSLRLPLRSFKRDSQTAQLDVQQSAAKRTQVLTSSFAHAALERQLAGLQADNLDLEHKLKEKIIQVERLENDRRWLADREAQERNEKEEEAARWEEDKLKSAAEIRSLRSTLSALKESHADLEETHGSLAHTAAQQKTKLTSLTHRTKFLEAELKAAQDVAEERAREAQELKSQLLAQIPSKSTGKENKSEDDALIQAELHRQTAHLRELERANTRLTGEVSRLRERNTSAAVLQEEKRALEGKLAGMETLRARVAELELQLQASSSSSLKTASDIDASATHALSALRLTHAQLLSEHGTTLEQLATIKAQLKAAKAQVAEADSAFTALEEEKDVLEGRLVDAEGKLKAAEDEVRFLQALAASYNEESQANHDAPDSSLSQAPTHLESLLNEYRASRSREQLDQASRDGAAHASRQLQLKEVEVALEQEREKLKEREERVKALTDEQAANLVKIDSLEQELFELRGEIAGGRHVPPGVRILQLADNPESRWVEMRQAALDRLKSENEALLNRLRELGANSSSAGSTSPDVDDGQEPGQQVASKSHATVETADLVPRASWELLNREKLELEEVVRQKEKRLLRLKEVYNAKGAEFRDAIASILGVKLSFRPNGEVRATSVYDLGASFAFQPAKGTMQLVAQGEGGPQDLPNLMRYWIADEQCIPGFMASVTLECYENAKRTGQNVNDSLS
ncbi:hypothetical protein H0H92_015153 [Tricholoma furcatifolium]|nr:hypothetical protein H0H92_015153 [Tricholoma furcatifolium]